MGFYSRYRDVKSHFPMGFALVVLLRLSNPPVFHVVSFTKKNISHKALNLDIQINLWGNSVVFMNNMFFL